MGSDGFTLENQHAQETVDAGVWIALRVQLLGKLHEFVQLLLNHRLRKILLGLEVVIDITERDLGGVCNM